MASKSDDTDETGDPSGATTGATTGVGVLDKSVALLARLATDGPARADTLARATGIARPTAHRLLVALETHGLTRRGTDGAWRLGLRHLEWAARAVAGVGLVDAARPVLARLRDDTGESAQLYLRQGDARVCVATAEPASGLRNTVPVGASLPLDRGSAGKVLLAWDPAAPGHDGAEATAVRTRGWAESVAEREPGVASVSAPLLAADGSVQAVLSVSGPVERFGPHPGERFGPAVRAAARDAERRAGLRGAAHDTP